MSSGCWGSAAFGCVTGGAWANAVAPIAIAIINVVNPSTNAPALHRVAPGARWTAMTESYSSLFWPPRGRDEREPLNADSGSPSFTWGQKKPGSRLAARLITATVAGLRASCGLLRRVSPVRYAASFAAPRTLLGQSADRHRPYRNHSAAGAG